MSALAIRAANEERLAREAQIRIANDEERLTREALIRYKRQGFDVDPDDAEHRQIYLMLKKNPMSRVSPEKILSAIASSKAVAKTGASVALNVYAVPMGNFHGGLPIDLKHFLKEPDDLKDFSTEVALDFKQFYLLDDSAPRSSLGLNVRQLNFFQKVHTTLDLGRPEAVLALSPLNGQPPDRAGMPAILDKATVLGQPEAPRQPQASRGLKRLASDTAEVTSVLDSAIKRRKQLGDILMQRKADLITAADKGDWHGSSQWSQDFVATHIDELLVVLKQIIKDEPAGGPMLAMKVGAFVQDVFLERKMYVHLHKFKGVFPQFAQLMAAPSAEPAATGAGAIEQLAAYGKIREIMAHFSPDQVINLDLSDTDVISRNTFRKTNLYWSFCEHTFQFFDEGSPGEICNFRNVRTN